MATVPWIHFVILALASFRLTHLIVFDEITSFLRKPFLSISYNSDPDGNLTEQIDIKGSGWRYFLGSVLSCHWCTGIWSSAFIVTVYYVLPIAFPLLFVLAIAGLAAIIESRLLK